MVLSYFPYLLPFLLQFVAPKHSDPVAPMILLYPRDTVAVCKTRAASIAGRVDTKQVAKLQMLLPHSASIWIKCETKAEKDLFAASVKDLFPEKYILRRAALVVVVAKNRSEQRREVNFELNKRIGLKEFWASTEFKDMYTSLYNGSYLTLRFSIEGWKCAEIDVTDNSTHAATTEVFRFPVPLVPGRNPVTVRALDTAGTVVARCDIALYYVNDFRNGPGAAVAPIRFHTDVFPDECSSCHDLDIPAELRKGGASVEKYCAPCHRPLATQASSHFPAAEFDCLSCHDAGATPPFRLLAEKDFGTGVCYGCHSEMKDVVDSSPSMHPPAADRCTACHDPHGSSERKLLVDDLKTVCGSCHEDEVKREHPVANHPVAPVMKPSEKTKQIDCASCHAPHGSPNKSLLVVAKKDFCKKCHAY